MIFVSLRFGAANRVILVDCMAVMRRPACASVDRPSTARYMTAATQQRRRFPAVVVVVVTEMSCVCVRVCGLRAWSVCMMLYRAERQMTALGDEELTAFRSVARAVCCMGVLFVLYVVRVCVWSSFSSRCCWYDAISLHFKAPVSDLRLTARDRANDEETKQLKN